MEFGEVVKNAYGNYFFHLGEDKKQRHVIMVHGSDIPDDFDPERTCRMIQSMEEMLVLTRDLKIEIDKKWGSLKVTDTSKFYGELCNLINFIEHGDKEETIFVGYFSDDIRDTRIKRIPKSEAIRLKLIKE